MLRLFHISEDPTIQVFTPRPANTEAWPDLRGLYVWSVCGELVHNYYFPRDCPRVCRMIGPKTTQEEITRFRAYGDYQALIFVEEHRKAEVESCALYRYEFNVTGFRPLHSGAGYYVSENEQKPIEIVRIENLFTALREAGAKLSFVADLEKYRRENAESNYRFSNIRMRNMG